MNLIYNSEQYSVVEFGADGDHEALRFGGYEIMDKSGQREIFIDGPAAELFRKDLGVGNLVKLDGIRIFYGVFVVNPIYFSGFEENLGLDLKGAQGCSRVCCEIGVSCTASKKKNLALIESSKSSIRRIRLCQGGGAEGT